MLEAAGIDFDRSGIGVDDRMRTSQKHIYAVGDCNGSPQFTHYAGWQGAMAARNAILPGTDPGIVELVPRVTFTDPEVASVGMSEAEARARYDDIVVSKRPMSRVDRAVIEGTGDGVVKVVHRRDGTIISALRIGSCHCWSGGSSPGVSHGLAGTPAIRKTSRPVGRTAGSTFSCCLAAVSPRLTG